MKLHSSAFLTTVFPGASDYINDFLESLAQQTDKDFDLVIANDGFQELEDSLRNHPSLNCRVICVSGSPAQNRAIALRFVKDQGYDICIFGDCDDYFDRNRVKTVTSLLKSCDIVVNDISLVHGSKTIVEEYFSNRVREGEEVDFNSILDKNLLGLSNTSMRLEIYDGFHFPADLIAVDWFLFSCLLSNSKTRCIFTAKTCTYYRQHESNTVGMKSLSPESFGLGIKVKILHYEAMIERRPELRPLLDSAYDLQKEKPSLQLLRSLQKEQCFPFWWELIKKS